ncbi:hypothetical protein [Holdemanella biformis]|uniref:Uncharacterized protein n=1 Tax=Holdemanella biformis TaxID=1735 RepID=A0A413UCB5_9FIRM|nr:hypothetical protein [Holdemanella biformis]RHB05425.1 hypothetical protein DW907_06630 [Holdemanella biformis]
MQFIKTLSVTLIPLFISIYLNRKYQLADKDRTIVEKQFEIYNLLYLNIARDTLNQPINGNLAKTNIIKLIKEMQKSTTLCNFLGPKLYEYLLFCNSNGISNSTLGSIQLQIESDLEQIKYKLGYPCKLKYKNRLMQYLAILISLIYIIINIVKEINENKALYSQTSKLLITYVCSILFIVSCYIFWILLNNCIFIKKYIEVAKTYVKNKVEK